MRQALVWCDLRGMEHLEGDMTRDDRDIPDLSDLTYEWPECVNGCKVDLLRLPPAEQEEIIEQLARDLTD